MHLCIFWDVVLSCAVTIPLTFGWIRCTLVEPHRYKAWFFGFPIVTFPIEAGSGFAIFHILDLTSILLIVGLAIAIWRRMNDIGLLSTQRSGFDLMPLVLLFAIAATGLALTASYDLWEGKFPLPHPPGRRRALAADDRVRPLPRERARQDGQRRRRLGPRLPRRSGHAATARPQASPAPLRRTQ